MVTNYESSMWNKIVKWIEENVEPLRSFIYNGYLRVGVEFV